ncbi:MAG TPA: alanine racemase [Vicinamibacterales bacterium]|nr:alanine racemase [Vicinamibacterales bacterium]
MIRSTVAHIDLDAIESNYRTIVSFLESQPREPGTRPPRVIAVVKANAYGHGAAPVALALERAGARMLACADIEEAVVLRRAGVKAEILVFGALSVSDLDGLVEYQLTPTISTPTAAASVEATARRHGVRLRYHLKIDTGMHRLGFRYDNLKRTLPPLLASPHLELAAFYTHFATADDPEHPLMDLQRQRFEEASRTLQALGVGSALRHAANSAAILRDARVWYDFVRPGLLLYGVVPPPLASTLPLRPAMSLRSRLVAIKGLRPGDSVGYGARFTADRPCTIGVVPAGYADGLDLRLTGRGWVLVGGRRAPIVGAVSMDMITVDLTGVPARPGDEVVLLGAQGDTERIDVREMAAAVGTIPWETLCRVGSRIERIYNSAQ